eukprot:gene22-31_t
MYRFWRQYRRLATCLLFGYIILGSCGCKKSTDYTPHDVAVPSEIIVFLGNPGAGKSTLCNAIFQSAVFESGISLEAGLTIEQIGYLYDQKRYIDTPGLSDIKRKEHAAKEIEKALKHNHNRYKIVFVVTLESGKIKAGDLVTINSICHAIKTPFEYGLIFNKLTDAIYKAIREKGLSRYLLTLNKQPSSTVLLKRENALEDQPGKYFEASSENRINLLNFLNELAANKIEAKDIEKIDVQDFQKKATEMEGKYREEIARINLEANKPVGVYP